MGKSFDRSRLITTRAVMHDDYSVEIQRSNGSDLRMFYRPWHTISYYPQQCRVIRKHRVGSTDFRQYADYLAIYPASFAEQTLWLGKCEALHLHIAPHSLLNNSGVRVWPKRQDPSHDLDLKKLMRALFRECWSSFPSSQPFLGELIGQIVERLTWENSESPADASIGRSSMQSVIARMNSPHIGYTNISHLARRAEVSETYFSRRFSAQFGCSPHEYILTNRVERAKNLIYLGEASLSDVALESGFCDQAHLSRWCCQKDGDRMASLLAGADEQA